MSRYGKLSGSELAVLTHGQTPWQQANEFRRPGTRRPISDDSIRDYFRRAAADELAESGRPDRALVDGWLAETAVDPRTDLPEPDDVDELRRRDGRGTRAS